MRFFVHIPGRQVFFADITANPTGAWTAQAARTLFLQHTGQLTQSPALIRHRASQSIDSFDEIFGTRRTQHSQNPQSRHPSPTRIRNGLARFGGQLVCAVTRR